MICKHIICTHTHIHTHTHTHTHKHTPQLTFLLKKQEQNKSQSQSDIAGLSPDPSLSQLSELSDQNTQEDTELSSKLSSVDISGKKNLGLVRAVSGVSEVQDQH